MVLRVYDLEDLWVSGHRHSSAEKERNHLLASLPSFHYFDSVFCDDGTSDCCSKLYHGCQLHCSHLHVLLLCFECFGFGKLAFLRPWINEFFWCRNPSLVEEIHYSIADFSVCFGCRIQHDSDNQPFPTLWNTESMQRKYLFMDLWAFCLDILLAPLHPLFHPNLHPQTTKINQSRITLEDWFALMAHLVWFVFSEYYGTTNIHNTENSFSIDNLCLIYFQLPFLFITWRSTKQNLNSSFQRTDEL